MSQTEVASGIYAFPHLEFPAPDGGYTFKQLEQIAHTMKEKLDLRDLYIYPENQFRAETNNRPIVVLRFNDLYYYMLYSRGGKSYGSPFWRIFCNHYIKPFGYSPRFFKIEEYLLKTLGGKNIQDKQPNDQELRDKYLKEKE